MSHDIKKPAFKQRKMTDHQQIKANQITWHKAIEELIQEKAKTQFKDLKWKYFLRLEQKQFPETTTWSPIADLQDRYKELIENQQQLWAEQWITAKLNKKHAVVKTPSTCILTEIKNPIDGQPFHLESPQSFKIYHQNDRIICFDNRERSKADVWLIHPNRRQYESGISFDPTTTEHKGNSYNLWRGFKRKPMKGDSSKFWKHVEENICDNDKELYMYVRKWSAYVFQHPDLVHTAIILCGSQGVGKNTFVDALGELLGHHYTMLSSMSGLVSNFNAHLRNAVLVSANEALWGGHKKDLGTIKSMVTDKTGLIEGKGRDAITVPNFKHFIFSSNEDWPVHLDPDDRRFVVLLVSEKHKGDSAYFKAIHEELNQGGYEALLHDLLNDDLLNEDSTKFDPCIRPSNANALEIKLRSADSALRYIHEALLAGGFSIGDLKENETPLWQGSVGKDSVYNDYVIWCEKNKETPLSKSLFGKTIKKVFPSKKDIRPNVEESRQRQYQFSSLQKAQEDFSAAFQTNPEDIFGKNQKETPSTLPEEPNQDNQE